MPNAKVALVSGAAQRIGRAICHELHRSGFDIALHYRHSEAAARELAAELGQLRPGSCALFQADLEDVAQVRALGAEVLAHYPRLELLVNNASGFEPTPISSCSEAQFDAMLGSNLKGPYFLIQALLPALRPAPGETGGSIVNILDVHIERPLPDFNVYGAAKAGLAALTRSLAVELGPHIRVNGVAPGAILWPEDDAAYDATARERLVALTPLQRHGEPADIARTVRFLALDAPFITGQIISVDGGRGLAS